jgi:SHS2 domain-containing protein
MSDLSLIISSFDTKYASSGSFTSSMTSNREPSIDLQRQIDYSITTRNRSIADDSVTADGATSTSPRRPRTYATGRGRAAVEEPGIPPLGSKFEYLDHPADIVLHSWGIDLPEALGNLATCMFGYITCLDSISISSAQSSKHGTRLIGIGHDLKSLVYSYLDEWLFNFHDTGFVPKEIEISELRRGVDDWSIVSSGKGEIWNINRHPQGTEVKAITYSGMRIDEKQGRCDVYVVVDI